MQIERVAIAPHKEVYQPGDVINISVYFQTQFVGQLEVGLVPSDHPGEADFRATTFAKSSNTLYEGQVYIWEVDIGACRLRARLAPVKGKPELIWIGDQILEVRPLVPIKGRN